MLGDTALNPYKFIHNGLLTSRANDSGWDSQFHDEFTWGICEFSVRVDMKVMRVWNKATEVP